ncbi:MAG: hypothetical protein AAGM67_19080 [Bacteroidota bacterium]
MLKHFPSFFTCCTKLIFLTLLGVINHPLSAQVGKDGASTLTTDAVLNAYTKVVADASVGDTLIQVMNVLELDDLEYGDLVLIIQMQGASINSATTRSWGEVSSLNNAGNYEFAYVQGVDQAANRIEFCSPLTQDYTASGNVQVVQVPQYTSFTVNPGITLSPQGWNGITGGVVAIHASGTVTIEEASMLVAGDVEDIHLPLLIRML